MPIEPAQLALAVFELCLLLTGAGLVLRLLLNPAVRTRWLGTNALPPLAVAPVDFALAAILIFFFAAEIFWAIFEQSGSSISLFADRLTQNEVLGRAFPSSWWQSVNSVWVILLAPVFAFLWLRLGKSQPSSPL